MAITAFDDPTIPFDDPGTPFDGEEAVVAVSGAGAGGTTYTSQRVLPRRRTRYGAVAFMGFFTLTARGRVTHAPAAAAWEDEAEEEAVVLAVLHLLDS